MTTYVDISYRIAGFGATKTDAGVTQLNEFIGQLRNAGHTGVAGYVSPYVQKNIPKWVCEILIENGFAIVLVWETSTTRAFGGRAAGVQDAAEAARQAAILGYPKGCVLFAAGDRNDYTVANSGAYFGGWRDKLRGLNYADGLYGPSAITSAEICTWNWGVETWGADHSNDDMEQQVNHPFHLVPGTDTDTVIRPLPAWTKANSNPPKAGGNDPRIQTMVTWLHAQVGYHEGKDSNGNWNNQEKYVNDPGMQDLQWAQGQPWCAVFTSDAAIHAGLQSFYPHTASVPAAIDWFRKNGTIEQYPAVGAWMFVNEEHVGVCVGFDSTYENSIEGNSNTNGSPQGDGVYNLNRVRKDVRITYGYPKGIALVSAKPGSPSPAPSPPPSTDVVVSLGHIVGAAQKDPRGRQGAATFPHDTLIVESALHKEGLLDVRYVDGSYGTLTVTAYAAWQKRLGYAGVDANGIPGMASLTKLGNKYGFRVVP